jgi:hypothetical protein
MAIFAILSKRPRGVSHCARNAAQFCFTKLRSGKIKARKILSHLDKMNEVI